MKSLYKISSLVVSLAFLSFNHVAAQQTDLPVPEFEKAISEKDIQLLDVRTAGEFQTGHINNAMQADWLDSAQFQERVKALDKSKPVYTYCLSGGRSGQAMNWLRQNGYTAYNLAGGMKAWNNAGMPVAAMQAVKQMTMDEYVAQIPNDKTVLVDFSADWCPPCIKMAPVLDSLQASQDNNFALVKIDGGAQAVLGKQLNVNAFPTFIIYMQGMEVWRKEGMTEMKEFTQHL